jgi:hypothetical protein
MKWWTILVADLLCSLVAGAALWILAFGEVADLAAWARRLASALYWLICWQFDSR